MRCIVACKLDDEDLEALPVLADTFKRVYLYGEIKRLYGPVFGLTALKDHINSRCVCTKDGGANE